MSIDPELSPKAHQELQAVAKQLCEPLIAACDSGKDLFDYSIGGGQTRVGAFEKVIEKFGDEKTYADRVERIKESLLIRVRQDLYSSIGFLESIKPSPGGMIVTAFCEHESHIAYRFTFRLKAKRPRSFSIGIPDTDYAKPCFFE